MNLVVSGLLKRIEQMKLELTITQEAMEFLAEKGYDPQFGARPLHRAVQKYLEDPLAEYILNENPEPGTKLKAVLNKEKDQVLISQSAKSGVGKKSSS
ncbi:MAG TPA: hypothetical protein PK209_14055 [Saprospiraceae bacterium]|nr:hypothetical protein [Saprospiraceae bacterium]